MPIDRTDTAIRWITDYIVEPSWATLVNLETIRQGESSLRRLEELRSGFQTAKDYVLGEYYPITNWQEGFRDSTLSTDKWKEVIEHFRGVVVRNMMAMEAGRLSDVLIPKYYLLEPIVWDQAQGEERDVWGDADFQTGAANTLTNLEEFFSRQDAKSAPKNILDDYIQWIRAWLKVMKRQYVVNVLTNTEFRTRIIHPDAAMSAEEKNASMIIELKSKLETIEKDLEAMPKKK